MQRFYDNVCLQFGGNVGAENCICCSTIKLSTQRPSLSQLRSDNFLLDFVMGKASLKGVSPWCTARLLSFLTLKLRSDSLVPDTLLEEEEKKI